MPKRDRNFEVRVYLKHVIETEHERGSTFEAIAKRVGVSKTQIINVKDHDRGAGPETINGFARAFHDGSIDALYKAAHAYVVANDVEPPPRDVGHNRALVMASPEYQRASAQVREVFTSWRAESGDKSVVEWSLILHDLLALDARGASREALETLAALRSKTVKSTR